LQQESADRAKPIQADEMSPFSDMRRFVPRKRNKSGG